jgi:hypothetical protein
MRRESVWDCKPHPLGPEAQVETYCDSATEYILARGSTLNLSGELLYARMPGGASYRFAYVTTESDEVIELNGHFLSPAEAAFTTIVDQQTSGTEIRESQPCLIHSKGTHKILFHQRTTAHNFRHWKKLLKECLTLPEEAEGYCIPNLSLWIELEFENCSAFSWNPSGINPQHRALEDVLFKMPGGKSFFRAM